MIFYAHTFPTALGKCSLAVDEAGAVIKLAYPQESLADWFARSSYRTPPVHGHDDPARGTARLIWSEAPCRRAAEQVSAFLAGTRRSFDLGLAPAGTAFQRRVWRALQEIPYGTTISYGTVAARIDQPRAAQAVGRANGANPIPIVIPCHRVIGADGSLTGYGGGLAVKEKLLQLEGVLMM